MRTRLRKLNLPGHSYTWRAEIRCVQGEGDCHRCIRVRIWGAGKTSRVLQADLLSKSWPAPSGACATDDAYPTTSDVRSIVEHALTEGWDPDLAGGTFLFTEAARWESPAFLLTDRLRDPLAANPSTRVIASYMASRAAQVVPPMADRGPRNRSDRAGSTR